MKIIQNPHYSFPKGLYLCYDGLNGQPGQPEALLKRVADKASLNGQSLKIIKKTSGKPYGRIDRREIGVAISHTKTAICCGMNVFGEIGLDIEARNRNVPEGLRQRITSDKEAAVISGIDTIRLWTIKEAVLKFTGTGLRMAMQKVDLSGNEDLCYTATVDNMNIRVISFALNGYWVSVAYSQQQILTPNP
ncbi:MAG: 4'-phosphopantetheinyl transferase superfamily protein [Balneolales bacterium]